MTNSAQPLFGFILMIVGLFIFYLILKYIGIIPGSGVWVLDQLDSVVTKCLELLKYTVPTLILISVVLPYIHIKKWWEDKKYHSKQKELRETEEYERAIRDERKKEEAVLWRLQKIETELLRLDDEIVQMNKTPQDLKKSALQDFL